MRRLLNLTVCAVQGLVQGVEDLLLFVEHQVACRQGPQGTLLKGHKVGGILVARLLQELGILCITDVEDLMEEHTVLHLVIRIGA